ncbi:Innexin family-containing protein [Strongyloides ratti]|uniref:Innexin n=1 Tax=Strongyloides ratti TaxID=34506 RepID=A0A090MPR3_STRRB|nr:Innexin family-containing protein [Strongyloides ratti]CEF60117.1 Innexin family-containing protein [Strongyloides ratti]
MDYIEGFFNINKRKTLDDSEADRIFHSYATVIFALFAILALTASFGFLPIHCQTPAEWASGWGQFASDICFVNGTTVIHGKDNQHKIPIEEKINYYQWVPYIFIVQFVMFISTKKFWSYLNRIGPLNVRLLVNLAIGLQKYSPESDDYKERMKTIIYHFREGINHAEYDKIASYQYPIGSCIYSFFSKISRKSYLSFVYILYKIVEIGVIVFQIKLISDLVAEGDIFYGPKLFYDWIYRTPLEDSYYFPRMVNCTFNVRTYPQGFKFRAPAIPKTRRISCILTNNIMNEVLFILNWIILCTMLFIMILSFISWTVKFLSSRQKKHFIQDLILFTSYEQQANKIVIINSIIDSITEDGIFILQMIHKNASVGIAGSILENLVTDILELKLEFN